MNRDLLNKIIYLVGTIGVFVSGLIFNVCSDLILKTASTWLFGSIVIAFGSGVCAILSDNFREKVKVSLSLKGVAIFLALGFVVFLVLYLMLVIFAFDSNRDKAYGVLITVISLVVAVISLAAQSADLGLSVKRIKDGE